MPMPMSRTSKWSLIASGAAVAAMIVYKVVNPAATPMPGWWHQGSIPVPCAVTRPYETWVRPDDGQTYALRYDYTAMFKSGGVLPRSAAQGAGNHTYQWYGMDGFIHPMEPQPDVDNYYPAPIADWGLCEAWQSYNTGPCPIDTLAHYQTRISATSPWITGQQFYAATRQQECSAPGPTPSPVRTPSPAGTPPACVMVTVTPQMICVPRVTP